jgi:toxin ParE1/3/4
MPKPSRAFAPGPVAARRKLLYSGPALEDLRSIVDWIREDSPEKALAFVRDLDHRLKPLPRFPSLGSLSSLPRFRKKGWRRLVIDKYLVYYHATPDFVRILRVIHSAQSIRL